MNTSIISQLINDPRDFKHNKIEEFLLHQSLVFPDELVAFASPALCTVGTWSEVRELCLEQTESLLRRFGVGLCGVKALKRVDSEGLDLDSNSGIVCREAISQHALNEQADNFEMDENLYRFREICPRETEKFGLQTTVSKSQRQAGGTHPKLLLSRVGRFQLLVLFGKLLF
jgi:hypothetical protein